MKPECALCSIIPITMQMLDEPLIILYRTERQGKQDIHTYFKQTNLSIINQRLAESTDDKSMDMETQVNDHI